MINKLKVSQSVLGKSTHAERRKSFQEDILLTNKLMVKITDSATFKEN